MKRISVISKGHSQNEQDEAWEPTHYVAHWQCLSSWRYPKISSVAATKTEMLWGFCRKHTFKTSKWSGFILYFGNAVTGSWIPGSCLSSFPQIRAGLRFLFHLKKSSSSFPPLDKFLQGFGSRCSWLHFKSCYHFLYFQEEVAFPMMFGQHHL